MVAYIGGRIIDSGVRSVVKADRAASSAVTVSRCGLWCGRGLAAHAGPVLVCISNDRGGGPPGGAPRAPRPAPARARTRTVGLSIAAARGGPHRRNCHTERTEFHSTLALSTLLPPYRTYSSPAGFLIEYQMRYSPL